MFLLKNFIWAVARALDSLLYFYLVLVVISALISWVNPDPRNPIVRFLYSVTEPVLYQIRRRLPFVIIGGFDLSRSHWTGEHDASIGLVFPIRSWEDYLTLATTEIRRYGASSIQVVRRMRAMLEELRDEVRTEHRPAVDEELERLDATVARSFADSVDIDRASIADPQGMGGRSGAVTRGPVR